MTSSVGLGDPLQYIRGVGPVRARAFATLGLYTVGDLIEHLPFRYDLKPKSQPIGSLVLDQTATIVGELRSVDTRRLGQGRVTATVVDGTGSCRVQWFNSAYLADKLRYGSIVRVTGKVKEYRGLASLTNPQLTVIDKVENALVDDEDHFAPVYSGTAELPSKRIAKTVDQVLDGALEAVTDFVPDSIRRGRNLPPRRTAVARCHRPTSLDDVPIARRRLAYDEFYLCQLAMQISRRKRKTMGKVHPVVTTDAIDRRIRGRLPFKLTAGQDQAIAEIRADLALPQPMNRLLQADVGAGKTAVAVYAALTTIANKRQVALLAPTEVLAGQHQAKIALYLEGSRVRTAYLAGSTTRSQRAVILRNLAAGKIDLVVGTHALLEPDVRFSELGLAIIDEQHKFGVVQRASLQSKGAAPHTLVLTATPIPRTLAMTVFGDLDVSTIEGVLPGRRPVKTRLVTPQQAGGVWEFVRSELDAGRQAYIVYPLVEESESLPLKAATVEVDRLSHEELASCRVGLLHGRLKTDEKTEVMRRFRAGELDALVSTTVIEVGVDVPNATIMIVQHAERYGLSQLHQLRGRIGRGSHQSYCLLFSDTTEGPASERLGILCETCDGFRIAAEDLRLRGPGEVLGTQQHGLPVFRVADLIADFDLLEQARDDAAGVLAKDENLRRPENAESRRAVLRRYGQVLKLVNVA